MSYLNSVTIVRFVRADPEQLQARNKRFEVHRSFRRHTALLEKRRRRMGLESRVASRYDISPSTGGGCSQQHQKGPHMLVEGSLVSSTYEQANGRCSLN